MFLKIVQGRSKKAKTKNLYIRGSYLGVRVDQSCKTDRRSVAEQILRRIEREIENGKYGRVESDSASGGQTFLSAANAYIESGKSPRYIAPLMKYFGRTPLDVIDQRAIDECAAKLYPHVQNPVTRNCYVYIPVSAILHHACVAITVRRPKGSKAKRRTNWFTPPDAFGIIEAADRIDPELATLLILLLYTGPRIGAALDVKRADLLLEEAAMWARPQKRQEPHAAGLHPDLRERLARHLATHDREKVIRWRYGGHLQWLFLRAKFAYLGIACPVTRPRKGWREPPNRLRGYTFHTWRHTWASWATRYGNATVDDLLDSGNWRDRKAASGYVHARADRVWDLVERFPALPKKTG